MAANHDDRVNDTLWLGALLLILSQYAWQFLEAWSRGLIVPWLASLALLLATASMGLVGFGRPRAHVDRAILWAAGVLLAGTVAWYLLPVAGAMKEPGRRETARLLLNRYLLAIVTLGPMLAVARLAGRSAVAAPRARIAPAALLVIAAFAVCALLVTAASRQAGVGPVGPAAAIVFMAVALATAVVVHRLPPRHDA